MAKNNLMSKEDITTSVKEWQKAGRPGSWTQFAGMEDQNIGAPVEMPEYYEGYGAQLQQVGLDVAKNQEALQTSIKTYEKTKSPTIGIDVSIVDYMMKGANKGVIPGWENKLAEAQAQLDLNTQLYKSSLWRQEVMTMLPGYLASLKYTINNYQDIVKYIPNEGINQADITWLEDVYEKMKHLSNILPDEYTGDVEDTQAQLLEDVLSEPDRPLKAVHNLTVDELAKSFQTNVELPKGMTVDQVRSVMSATDLEIETDLNAWLEERAADWAAESEKINLIRAGLIETTSPDLTPKEFLNLLVVQPMMGTIELVDKYFDLLARPLATQAIVGFHRAFNTSEATAAARLEEQLNYYQSIGYSSWSASAKAFTDWDANMFLKMGIETAFDPTTYIGFGLIKGAGTKLITLGGKSKYLRFTKAVGTLMSNFETGWIEGSDLLFKAGLEVFEFPIKGSFWLAGRVGAGALGYEIPKTLTTAARSFARESVSLLKSVIERTPSIGSLRGMTAVDLQDIVTQCLNAVKTRPYEGGDLMVQTGARMMESEYLDATKFTKLLKEALPATMPSDDALLAHLNTNIVDFMAGQSPRITAGKMIMNLGTEPTEDMVSKVATRLTKLKDDIAQKVIDLASNPDPEKGLIGLFEHLNDMRYSNLKSSLSLHMREAGRSTSWVTRMADQVLYATKLVDLERKVVMPFARWNLLFANFGPANFTENMGRSFAGGADLIYPKGYTGISETNRLFAGLSNSPYELQMVERGINRLEQAILDPKTGESAIFKGGKIPFVTKNVSIGGHKIGFKLSIGPEDFYISDLQSYNDMWEVLTTKQRAYDYQVHYMNALNEVAGPEMDEISRILSRHKKELNDIGFLSKKEAAEVERAILQDATVSPDEVLKHANVDVPTLERRKVAKEINKIFDECDAIPSSSKTGIRDQILDGSMFKDIDATIDGHIAAARDRDLISLSKQIQALKDEAASLIPDPDAVVRTGYRGGRTFGGRLGKTTGGVATEGEGLYVALDAEFAEGFGDVTEISFKNPKSVLNAGGEMPMFREEVSDLIYEPIKASDSEWVKLNKQAAQNVGFNPTNRDVDAFSVELNRLGKEKGYDAFYIEMSDEERFYVLLDENLYSGVYSPPKNLDEFLSDINSLTAMSEAVSDRIHDYRKLVELRSGQLKGKTADDFEIGSSKLLADFMETSETELNRIMDSLSDIAKGTGRLESADVFSSRINKLFSEGPVELVTDVSGSNVYLQQIGVIEPEDVSKGLGSKALKTLTEEADNSGVTIVAESVPTGDLEGMLNEDQLLNWYKKYGFEEAPEGLPHIIRKPKSTTLLNDTQLSRLSDLDSVTRLELENILATRNKILEIESVIPKTPAKKRTAKFWQQQRAAKSAVWDAMDAQARKLRDSRYKISRYFLSSVDKPVYLPKHIPEVTEGLTPSHIAYLFGVTGDDLYRGLTRVSNQVTVRPKEDFIVYVRNQADAYAEQFGKVASDIGFTDDAIADVYDQLWRNVGVDPVNLTPDSPTMMQFEEVRQNIHSLHSTHKMDENDVVKWKQYVQGVTDDLKKTSMYNKPIPATFDNLYRTGAAAGVSDAGTFYYIGKPEVTAGLKFTQSTKSYKNILNLPDLDMDMPSEALARQWFPRKAKYFDSIAESMGYDITPVTDKLVAEEATKRGYDAINYGNRTLQDISVLSSTNLQEISLISEGEKLVALARQSGKDIPALSKFEESLSKVKRARTMVSKRKLMTTMESLEDEIREAIGAPLGTTLEFHPADPWIAKKESAMSRARELHSMAYPTYDDNNIIDETMRTIFPFWNYESFRWKWIPRTWMRTPGTMTGIARYMDYTDGGYIPVPGTDLQLNPLRGSIWMGGLRSLYLRDFPEYYDAIPGMEALDYISRLGFFPGIHIMAPIVAAGAISGKPEVGQLLPSWVSTGFDALVAIAPEHGGKIRDFLFPDRFRDYLTMLTLGKHGYDADEIWRKKTQGQKLTEEETTLWYKMQAEATGLKGILMAQTGMFRVRPEEFDNLKSEMRLAIEEATGVSVAIQQQIDRHYPVTGKRFQDYYKLDVAQQQLLYSMDSFRRWQGVTTSLYPSSWQALDVKVRDYYDTLDKLYTDARMTGVWEGENQLKPSMVEVNQQLVDGTIGPDQWKSQRDNIYEGLSEAARALGNSPAYKDVPKTLEEREAMLAERNTPLPTYGPDQELLWYYYELQPEYTYDWESGRMAYDYDTYYAKIDALLDSLSSPHRDKLLQRIQSDWTPMEKLYWQTSREYLRAYRNVRNVVLSQYSEEERQIIRRYEVARGEERTTLSSVISSSGNNLVSEFTSTVSEARKRLRILDPDLDAWLYFWGTTDKFNSLAAEEKYNEFKTKYLTPSMVK